jgi:flagellar motor switch protein FliN/FliY
MSAEPLSQNEVNALLEDDSLFPDYGEVPQKEIIAIFMKNIPQYLKEGLIKFSDTRIGLSHLQISIKNAQEIIKDIKSPAVLLTQPFKDSRFEGAFSIVVEDSAALKMAKIFLRYPELSLNIRAIKDLEEAFSNFSDAMFSSIEADFNKAVPLDVMKAEQVVNAQETFDPNGMFLEMSFSMTLASVSCPVYMLLPVYFAGSLAKLMDEKVSTPTHQVSSKSARPVQFSQLEEEKFLSGAEGSKIDILFDVSMQLTAELGRTRIKVRDILSLGEGSIIELQKLAGEAIDILVNGKVIARGEVVVIDEYFGIRLTEILAPKEIIPALKSN